MFAGITQLRVLGISAMVTGVTTLTEIESTAMSLPDQQRAVLASHLLESLPAVLHEDDGGIAEALRRDAELHEDPYQGMTMAEFKQSLGR